MAAAPAPFHGCAQRRTALVVNGTPPAPPSTLLLRTLASLQPTAVLRAVETEDVSSGVGPITNLCQWAADGEGSPTAPWLLTQPPTGYDPAHFAPPPPWAHSRKPQSFVDGNCCPHGAEPNGCAPEVFRYQGLPLSTLFAEHTGSTGPSLPGGYLLPDNRTHYL